MDLACTPSSCSLSPVLDGNGGVEWIPSCPINCRRGSTGMREAMAACGKRVRGRAAMAWEKNGSTHACQSVKKLSCHAWHKGSSAGSSHATARIKGTQGRCVGTIIMGQGGAGGGVSCLKGQRGVTNTKMSLTTVTPAPMPPGTMQCTHSQNSTHCCRTNRELQNHTKCSSGSMEKKVFVC